MSTVSTCTPRRCSDWPPGLLASRHVANTVKFIEWSVLANWWPNPESHPVINTPRPLPSTWAATCSWGISWISRILSGFFWIDWCSYRILHCKLFHISKEFLAIQIWASIVGSNDGSVIPRNVPRISGTFKKPLEVKVSFFFAEELPLHPNVHQLLKI